LHELTGLPSIFTITDDVTGEAFSVDESPLPTAYAEFHTRLLTHAKDVAHAQIDPARRAERQPRDEH
jgi:hypothetical protein